MTQEAFDLLHDFLTGDFFAGTPFEPHDNMEADPADNNDNMETGAPDNNGNDNTPVNIGANIIEAGLDTLNFFTMVAETLSDLQLEALELIQDELLIHLLFLQLLLDEHPRDKKRPYPFDDDDDEDTNQGAYSITV